MWLTVATCIVLNAQCWCEKCKRDAIWIKAGDGRRASELSRRADVWNFMWSGNRDQTASGGIRWHKWERFSLHSTCKWRRWSSSSALHIANARSHPTCDSCKNEKSHLYDCNIWQWRGVKEQVREWYDFGEMQIPRFSSLHTLRHLRHATGFGQLQIRDEVTSHTCTLTQMHSAGVCGLLSPIRCHCKSLVVRWAHWTLAAPQTTFTSIAKSKCSHFALIHYARTASNYVVPRTLRAASCMGCPRWGNHKKMEKCGIADRRGKRRLRPFWICALNRNAP